MPGLADQIAEIRARQGGPQKGLGQPAPAERTTNRRRRRRRGKHDWGDGRGRVHSISLERHKRNVRVKANDRNPLYDPTQQLSGNTLAEAADDLVNLEFAPQKAALQRRLENETTQGNALIGRQAGYQQQLAANDATLSPQVAAIGQLLNDTLGKNTAAAQGQVNSYVDESRQRNLADAQLHGIAADTAGIEKEGAAQVARLAEQGQGARNQGALNTQAFQQLAQLSANARAQMGQEVQGQLLNRLANAQAETRAQQTDLAGQEGAARSARAIELRQQGFENLITQSGLDIKSEELKAQTAQEQARLEEQRRARRSTARQRRLDRESRETIARENRNARAEADRLAREGKASEVNKYGVTNKRWLEMSEKARMRIIRRHGGRGSGSGSSMPATAQGTRNGIDNALIDIRDDRKLARHAANDNWPRVQEILQNRGAPPIVAKAAREIGENGKLSASTIAALRRAKVRVPRSWINPPYNPPGAAGPPAPGT